MQPSQPPPLVSPARKRGGAPGSRLPHLKLPSKTVTATAESGLPSPSTPVRETKPDIPAAPPTSPTKTHALGHRLQAFRADWQRLIHAEHPNRDTGLAILDDLLQTANLEKPSGIAHYGYYAQPDQQHPDLAKLAQIDLSALSVEANRLCMLVDQRTDAQKAAVLRDGDDVRAALACGAPVALYLNAGARGLLRARVALPHYRILQPGATLVGGQGFFALALPNAAHQAVLTQAVGQCVLLDFPTTPENRSKLAQKEADVDFRGLFKWARQQPGACVRVLQPGDHIFMPALQARLVISLGHNGSSYSATALTYVRNDFMDVDRDDERRRKKPKTE